MNNTLSGKNIIKIVRRPFRPLKRIYQREVTKLRFRRMLQPGDVFIVGHPKSGNTLIAYCLAIAANKDFAQSINLANINDYVPGIHNQDLTVEKYRHDCTPRLFRNEVPNFRELYPKSIYILRDPRAVLVSYFHMYRTIFDDSSTSLDDFIQEYLEQGNIKRYEPGIVRWDRQVRSWLDIADNHRVMVVKYEDLVKKKPEVLKHLLDFSEIAYTQELFDHILERSSFEAMRQIEEKYGEENYPGEMAARGRFIRKGKAEGWKEELSKSAIAAIETEFSDVMKRAGYLT